MPLGVLDTGFDEALARGLGLGLHARSLDESDLYRRDKLQRDQEALQNQVERTDIMRMRAEDTAAAAQERARQSDLKLYDKEATQAAQHGALYGSGQHLFEDLTPPTEDDFAPGPLQATDSLYTPQYQQAGQEFAGNYADLPPQDRMSLAREAVVARKSRLAEKAQKSYEQFTQGTAPETYPGGPDAWNLEHDRRYVSAFGASGASAMHRLAVDRDKTQGFGAEAQALAQEFPDFAGQFQAIADSGQSPRGLAGQLRATATAAARKRLPTPEEAETRVQPLIDGLTARMGHAPDALTVATIRDRVSRGERVTGNDLLSAGVEERYVHAGLEAAQKEELSAAEKMYRAADRAYAAGLKSAGGDPAAFTATDKGAAILAERVHALQRWSTAKAELTDLQRGRKAGETPVSAAPPSAVQPAMVDPTIRVNPAALAPTSSPQSADPLQQIKAQLPDPVPGDTREQYKARVRSMMQKPPVSPAGGP